MQNDNFNQFREKDTIQSLLEQNDELLARLNAQNKKNAEMERRLRESEHLQLELEQRAESLSEQVLILREKDKIQKGRVQEIEKKFEVYQSEKNLQEVRYSELYTKKREAEQKHQKTLLSMSKKLGRSLRFREWVKNSLYPSFRDKKRQIADLKSSLKDVHQYLYESDTNVKAFKDEIENLKKSFDGERRVYDKTQSELKELNNRYLKLKDERTVHQNRVVAAERLRDELQQRYQSDLQEWQDKTSLFRQEAKTLQLENQSLKKEYQEAFDELKKLRQQHSRLRDQNESVQELWTENRKRIEQLSSKEEALQKLNQELSLKLKEARHEISLLTQKASEAKEISESTIKKMKTEFALAQKSSNKDEPSKEQITAQKTVEKLEGLLAEIQSGYSQPQLQTELKNYDFIEKEELMSEEGDLQL